MLAPKRALRFASTAGSVATLAASRVVHADISVPGTVQNGASAAQPDGSSSSLTDVFKVITNTILYIVGAIAVIMLVVGGLQYVLSTGDSKRVESAKNTILYAIIGIVVAILAYAIVNFVFGRLQSGGATSS